MSREARVHPRLRLNATADVIGTEVMLGRPLGDLSLGGCRFDGPAWEEKGSTVDLVLAFPASDASIVLAGEIVRTSEEDMGVRFKNLDDEQKWALRKHLRRAQASGPQRAAT